MPTQNDDWTFPRGTIIPYYPRVKGLDWCAYMSGPGPLVVVNDELLALKLCLEGVPSIAIVGVSKECIAEWIRERGANVTGKAGAH